MIRLSIFATCLLVLTSCDAVLGGPDFEATASGAIAGAFSGDGRALVINDIVSTTYSLVLDDDERLSLGFHRQRLTAPQAGTYSVQTGWSGETPRDFGANVGLYGTDGRPGGTADKVTGTLTIERCTRSDLRGRFDLSGTFEGEPLAITGTFNIPRVDSGWRPDESLGSCS